MNPKAYRQRYSTDGFESCLPAASFDNQFCIPLVWTASWVSSYWRRVLPNPLPRKRFPYLGGRWRSRDASIGDV